jgi:hypothetical protein
MDSSRTEVLLGAGAVLASAFVMGILGAHAANERTEGRREREAAAVDREFDQLQDDGGDLVDRLEAIDARLARIEAAWAAVPIPAPEDPG